MVANVKRFIKNMYFILVILIAQLFCVGVFAGNAVRIISLAPSNTLLLSEINAQNNIVGQTNYCRNFNTNKNSKIVASFDNYNLPEIIKLKPEYIILTSGQEFLYKRLSEVATRKNLLPNVRIILLSNNNLEDIINNVKYLGDITDNKDIASRKINLFKTALTRLSQILNNKSRPQISYVLWQKPIIVPGSKSFICDLINYSGGLLATNYIAKDYATINSESLIKLNSDVLFLPENIKVNDLFNRSFNKYLKCIKSNKVFYYNDNYYLNYPCLKSLNGIYWLAVKIHPELKIQLNKWYETCVRPVFF